MNKLGYIGLCAMIGAGLCGCNSAAKNYGLDHHDHGHSHQHEAHSHEGHDHHEHGHDHNHAGEDAHGEEDGNEITLDVHQAEEFGVKTTVIEPSDFSEIIKVSGSCEASPTDATVATATSSGILTLSPGITIGKAVNSGQSLGTISAKGMSGGDANANAAVAVEVAKKELDRLAPLHKEGIVSTRDYNAAEAEYKRALAAAGSSKSGSSVVARSAGIITELTAVDGAYVEAGAPIAVISANKRLMIRADLPVRFSSAARSTDCNIAFPGIDSIYSLSDLGGRAVASASGSVKNGYIPVYFEIESDGIVRDGMLAEVYLKGASKQGVITVPLSAVTEQQGVNFVYERLDEDCYRKLPVKLGNNDGKSVEIVSGLEPGKEIVTEGVLFVKLAESSGAVPEGHSHSH